MKVTANAGQWTGLYLELITKVALEDHSAVAKIRDQMQTISVTISLTEDDLAALPGWFTHLADLEPEP
jgi:hypothetical protein